MMIGAERFHARLQYELAPQSCARLEKLIPYHGKLIHARWSGESCWSPLAAVWPSGTILPPENATGRPSPGQVLIFAGELSEPELLIAYGTSRFASRAGPLAGNPVLAIEDRLSRLADLGREILWHGAMDLRLERPAHHPSNSSECLAAQECAEEQSTAPRTGEVEHVNR